MEKLTPALSIPPFLGVAQSTYARMEKGDPAVAMGSYAMALFVLGFSEALGDLVDAQNDEQGLLLDEERLPKRARVWKSPTSMKRTIQVCFSMRTTGNGVLAPAFDINPFPERMWELKNLDISEETGPEATIEALFSVIAYFRIPLARERKMLGEIERAVSCWRDSGRALGMSDRELDQFADAFEHPERNAAQEKLR